MTTYKKYADALQLFQENEEDLDAILDPRNGYAPLMREICLTEREEADQVDILRMEQDTWSLVQAVVSARKTALPPYVPTRSLHEYTPTSTLAEHIVNGSPFLNELIIIREWLQDVTPAPAHPEATTGYWPFTKHAILHAARTAGGPRNGIVKEMDPDVVSRGPLAPDDANFEKNFCQTLFAYIRAGRIEAAIQLCHRAHQPWRAASIRGSKLFRWQELSAGDAGTDDEESDEEDVSPQGTRNRRLWKSTCIRAALNQSLPMHERVLFAALAPSPQTFAVLKGACRTFSDHIWATVSVICEEKISNELAKLSNYWEETLDRPLPWITEEEEEAEDEEWQAEKQEVLAGLASIPVEEGPGPEHPYHVAQLQIILDRTSTVFDSFADQLLQSDLHEGLYYYIRFFTHLALYYKMVGLPVPPASVQVILEAYLSVLENNGLHDLIALYAAALGDNAIARYATFLVHSDPADRRGALNQAKDHHLDVDRVATAAAEFTLAKAFEELPAPTDELPVLGIPEPPNDMQRLLLRSIEWTTFYESTYTVALEQSNAIFRYFLAMGLPTYVLPLLDSLPLDLAPMADREHIHYRQFFALWKMFDSTTSMLSSLQPHAKEHIARYKELLADTHAAALKLLTSDWMIPDSEEVIDHRSDMARIRMIYIPEFVFRLHALLYASRTYVHSALTSLMHLTNTVADSRYSIYEAFGDRLPQYLTLVRQGVLATLEGGGSDPFSLLQH